MQRKRKTVPLESETTTMAAPWAEPVPGAPFPMTDEQFLAWPGKDGYRYELIDGRLVRMPNSWEHMEVLSRLNLFLAAYVISHPEFAYYVADGTYRLRLPGGKTPKYGPDASLIRRSRLPPRDDFKARKDALNVAPDLMIEIASQGQRPSDMAEKARQVLSGGVQMVWIIYPLLRSAEIWRPDNTSEPDELLGMADYLDALEVAPGLRIPVHDVLV